MKKTIEIEEPRQQKQLPDHYIDIMLEKYKPANTYRIVALSMQQFFYYYLQ